MPGTYPGYRWLNQKPLLGSQIDRSHPLARGLIACVLNNEGGGPPRDLVAGLTLIETGAPAWTAGADGPAKKLDGSSQYLTIPYNAAVHSPAHITIAARLRSDTASDNQYIVNRNYDGNSVPYSLGITPNTGDGGVTAGMAFFNGTWNSSGVGGTAIGGDGRFHAVAGTYGGVTLDYYLDGVLRASAPPFAGGDLPAANVNPIDLGAYHFSSHLTAMTLDYLFIWDHAKAAADIAALAADPFAGFRAAPARRFFLPAGGGGGTPSGPCPASILMCM